MTVNTVVPAPELCDLCCSLNVVLVVNHTLTRELGVERMMYVCRDCGARVGCHPGTITPFGRMCDGATARLRRQAHSEFDKLWAGGLMTRTKAYAWLSLALGVNYEQCHISQLGADQLKDVITLSSDYLANHIEALRRRKEKKNAAKSKRNERTKSEQFRKLVSDHKQKRKRFAGGAW